MTKHLLTLRPAFIGSVRLTDDYVVRRDLRAVGRIHCVDRSPTTGQVWEWGINLPLPTPWWCLGRASSFEAAKVAFLNAWMRYYAELSPEHVALWHKQQDTISALLRRPRDWPVDGVKSASEDIAAQARSQPMEK
jgi:hypothetical protein